MRYLAAFFLLFASTLEAKDPLPLIEETYDEVWVMHIEKHSYDKICFIKDGKLIATRTFASDMLWSVDGTDFLLSWNDYHHCHRIIKFKTFVSITLPFDPTRVDGPWWAMARNMTDLKQPER